MHYVYLIESTSVPGVKYTGSTDNLKQRLDDHNSGKNVSTAWNRLWRLKTYLAFSTKFQALAFERHLKSGQATPSPPNDFGEIGPAASFVNSASLRSEAFHSAI